MIADPQPRSSSQTPDLQFDDTATAFSYQSDAALRRSHLLFRTVQQNWLVRLGPGMVQLALRLHLPIEGLLRTYFFEQFCGGETLAETMPKAEMLAGFGVSSILDYAVEAQKTERGYDTALAELLRVVQVAAARPEVSFAALKMTGIGSFDLMEKRQRGTSLSGSEQMRYARMRERLDSLCAEASRLSQPLLLDAEESWIQDEIDRLAEDMMRQYNRGQATLYTTVQLYRHDRLAYLQRLAAQAQAEGWVLGVKLVRGAYLEKENARAAAHGYPTPMQPNKARTDADFDAAASFCLAHLDHVALCAGTHNEHSCRRIAEQMAAAGHAANHPRVHFAQLYGMSDHISFNLARAGYNVAKYLPYGPLEAVLPYLFRRAQENTSIAGQSSRELLLIEQELKRRKTVRLLKR